MHPMNYSDWFPLPRKFTFLPPSLLFICVLCAMFQERSKSALTALCGLIRRHSFCTAVWLKTALCVVKSLAAAIAARERVTPFDDPNMGALNYCDRSSMQLMHLTPTDGEVLKVQCRYNAPLISHRIIDVYHFTEEPTIWIHQNASYQTGHLMLSIFCYALSLLRHLQRRWIQQHRYFYSSSSTTTNCAGCG